jgi:hypothetical protein
MWRTGLIDSRTIDCIYIAASANDARFTRICVASIRHFYPEAVIKLLAGGKLEPGLREELARHWNVGAADIPTGNWGWGFVKLEPLFGRAGERFLVVDSDTIFAGPVLDAWAASAADFLVDDERQTEADTRRLYYDWSKVAAIDSTARPPQFVFNTGQWFGTAGVLDRRDFDLMIDWDSLPPKLRHPALFPPNDQGVMNYVINRSAMSNGLLVGRSKIMHWPSHGMNGITAKAVIQREAPPVIVHWAGLKAARLRTLPGADVLALFEGQYYSKIPLGLLLMRLRSARSFLAFIFRVMLTRAQLVMQKLRALLARQLVATKAPTIQ